MERFLRSRSFAVIAYTLCVLLALYLLQLLGPMIASVYGFLKAVLSPFLIAMIISYVLNPIVNMLNNRKVPRTIAVLLIYAVFITSLVVILINFIPMFMKQLNELNEHMPELTMRAESIIYGINDHPLMLDSVRIGMNNMLVQFERSISESITDLVSKIGSTISMIFVAFIVPFLAFYILKDYQLIERTVIATVPKAHRKHIVRMLSDIDTALGNYVRGQFLVCVIIGVLAYIGYLVIDIPYPLLLASVVAIFNIIPYLGPFLGAAPAIIVASTVSWKMVLFTALVNLTVQVIEGNVISPQVVGKKLQIHPLTIIFVLLVGGQLAGIVGLILAVPTFAVLKVVTQHIFLYYRQRTKK